MLDQQLTRWACKLHLPERQKDVSRASAAGNPDVRCGRAGTCAPGGRAPRGCGAMGVPSAVCRAWPSLPGRAGLPWAAYGKVRMVMVHSLGRMVDSFLAMANCGCSVDKVGLGMLTNRKMASGRPFLIGMVLLAVLSSGCASPTPTTPISEVPTESSTKTVVTPQTATGKAGAVSVTATATASLPGATPTPVFAPGVSVVGYGAGQPDDLTLDVSGAVIFSDQGNSGLNELAPDGTLRVIAKGFKVPEGVVLLPDGSVVVAEQGTNRLWVVDRSSGAVRLLAEIPNPTGKAGIDGLGYDQRQNVILVPDSANGRLLRLNPSDGRWQEIARGFVRPTGAAVGTGGDIYVADEFGQGVYRVEASGRTSLVVQIKGVDDVAVTQDGLLLMALLDGRLLRLEKDGSLSQLAKVNGPVHGLAVDRDGSLVFSDMGGNRILRWRP